MKDKGVSKLIGVDGVEREVELLDDFTYKGKAYRVFEQLAESSETNKQCVVYEVITTKVGEHLAAVPATIIDEVIKVFQERWTGASKYKTMLVNLTDSIRKLTALEIELSDEGYTFTEAKEAITNVFYSLISVTPEMAKEFGLETETEEFAVRYANAIKDETLDDEAVVLLFTTKPPIVTDQGYSVKLYSELKNIIMLLRSMSREYTRLRGELDPNEGYNLQPLMDIQAVVYEMLELLAEQKFEVFYEGAGLLEVIARDDMTNEQIVKQILHKSRIVVGAQEGKLKCGRNEACPCGSGKKFKKCCGLY